MADPVAAATNAAKGAGNFLVNGVKKLFSWKGLAIIGIGVAACAVTPAGAAAASQVFATAAAPGAPTGFLAGVKTVGSASWAAASNGAGSVASGAWETLTGAFSTAKGAIAGAAKTGAAAPGTAEVVSNVVANAPGLDAPL